MEQGRTAVCPLTTVTFTIGTSNVGSIPITNIRPHTTLMNKTNCCNKNGHYDANEKYGNN